MNMSSLSSTTINDLPIQENHSSSENAPNQSLEPTSMISDMDTTRSPSLSDKKRKFDITNPNTNKIEGTLHPTKRQNPETIFSITTEELIKLPIEESEQPILKNLSHQSIEDLWQTLEGRTTTPDCLSTNEVDNRFADIFCPRLTAVQVDNQYIHANFVGEGATDHRFIASQAPTKKELENFWTASFQHGIIIMDLTNFIDRTQKGVNAYYPQLMCQESYGSMTVLSLQQRKINDGLRLHFYNVSKGDSNPKRIMRFEYSQWPDRGVIDLKTLDQLVTIINDNQANKTPLLTHCRAGVGRTGTLITAIILKEKIEKGHIHADNLESELIELILLLRTQRGVHFVQSLEQFELLVNYGRNKIQS